MTKAPAVRIPTEREQRIAELRTMLRSYERTVEKTAERRGISTSDASLDGRLRQGGLIRGQLVELLGPLASGRLSLALRIMAAATSEGLRCALVDTDGMFYPPGASRLGVVMSRLLVVQPPGGRRSGWAAEQLARSQCFDLVTLSSPHAIPDRQGRRLRQSAEQGASVLLLTGAARPRTQAADVRLSVGLSPRRERRGSPAAELRVAVLKGGSKTTPLEISLYGPLYGPATASA